MALLRLALRNLLRFPLRSLLTIGALALALFLLCTLRSMITTLEAGLEAASSRRMVVQSAVSLFVELPVSYQPRIADVEGVELISKWQWFGGYYQDEANQFPQFAVDPGTLLEFFPNEMEIVQGSPEAWEANRLGCMIGDGLARRFGWEVGDRIPLIGVIFPHPEGADVPWEFEVEAVYTPLAKSFQDSLLLFHWDYFEKTREAEGVAPGVGTYYVKLEQGAEPTAVMAAIDALFENGPQAVQATPEAEFQAQFVSMLGNVPFFISAIGGGVLAAILLACVNTMLMAAREQTRDIGIMKALGFTDARASLLLVAQALLLCAVGGGLGLAFALLVEDGMAEAMGIMFPGYAIASRTIVLGVVVTLGIGLFSGLAPAWRARRLRCIEALSERE